MATQFDLKSLLRESVHEYLFVADYCVQFQKDSAWPQREVGGCLGYPAAVMLFSIVDTIGSFHQGDAGLNLVIDGKSRDIRNEGFQHFFILNSDYYGQSLEEAAIKKLYDNFRNLLVHNASLAPSNFLIKDPGFSRTVSAIRKLTEGQCVSVSRYFARCSSEISYSS
jgi:hypothetical protein